MRSRLSIAGLAVVLAACGGGGPAGPSSPGGGPGPTVGPAGGNVASPDGSARLVVPSGALAQPTALVLRSTANVPLDPHAVGRAGYELAPAGTVFASPATLSIRYDPSQGPSGTDESEWRLAALNGGEWQTLAQGQVAPGSREATASVGGAGIFGVHWPGPATSCGSAQDRQFDFWLGSWSFAAPGSLPGTNEITKEGRGCLVEEHFQDSSGTRGRSVSLYSRQDGQWHQTYIDSRGGRLVLIGTWDGRRMVLAESASQRYLWQQIGGDVVRYWGERSADGGASFSVFFDSTYTRR